MCLAYRNNEEYFKCMNDNEDGSPENIHGWKQTQWECGVNLCYTTAKDLYPQERNCCAWTKHFLDSSEKPLEYCGLTIFKGETSNGMDKNDLREQCCETINPAGEKMPVKKKEKKLEPPAESLVGGMAPTFYDRANCKHTYTSPRAVGGSLDDLPECPKGGSEEPSAYA